MAAAPSIDLGDFTCSISTSSSLCVDSCALSREIFEDPASLPCAHCYCRVCLNGLRKLSASSSLDSASIPRSQPSPPTLIYKPKIHEANHCFMCAICRKESMGYLDCRDLEADLKTLEALCPHCQKSFIICDLRNHVDKCILPKKKINVTDIKKVFNPNLLKQLSESQAQALEKARDGENRSTFQCPYCSRPNFTLERLCKHMQKHHSHENPSRVCPICASMPWGNKEQLSSNVYVHIMARHRFDYETYVNYEQDEETMMAEAVKRSMSHH